LLDLCIALLPPAYGQFLKANGEEPVTWKRAATMEDVLREADVVRFSSPLINLTIPLSYCFV
jgi:glycerate dehydrogenase